MNATAVSGGVWKSGKHLQQERGELVLSYLLKPNLSSYFRFQAAACQEKNSEWRMLEHQVGQWDL